MKTSHWIPRVIVSLLLAVSAQAGTSELFQASVKLKSIGKDLPGNLGNKQLINLALGHPLKAKLPAHMTLGLQLDCATLQQSLVVYDNSTTDTVATIATFTALGQQVNEDGWISLTSLESCALSNDAPQAGGLASVILRPGSDVCAAQASISLTGHCAIASATEVLQVNLRNGLIRTIGDGLPIIVSDPVGGSSGDLSLGLGSGNALVVTNGGVILTSPGNGNSLNLPGGFSTNTSVVLTAPIDSGGVMSMGIFDVPPMSNFSSLVFTSNTLLVTPPVPSVNP